MNKTNKATHNSNNYNRKRMRRFKGQKVEVKDIFERYIADKKIILKMCALINDSLAILA